MKKNAWIIAAGVAVLVPVVMALPSRSAGARGQDDAARVTLEELLRAEVGLAGLHQRVKPVPGQGADRVTVLLGDEGPSWLGVETQEVSADKVRELKLPAERGVVVGRITPDSPAAKAGLKENDVITEVDGQRVEGSTQFRRLIHEIPSGRTVQLTVWREGRSQTLNATLGKAEESRRGWMNAEPGAFSFRMPEVEIPEMPEVPAMEWDNGTLLMPGARPRLGIDAEDISGQLGAYFGAPDGEGILVRNVNPGSAAEKGGVKAGDVITTFNGERIRSLGDLREKLAAKSDDKSAKLGVLRNKSVVTVTIELPAPKSKTLRRPSRSTNI